MRSGLCRPAGGRTAPEGPGFLGSRAPRRPAGAPHIDPRGAGTACAGETAGGVQVCAQSAHPRSSGAVGDHGPERAVAWSCVAHHPPSQGTPCPDPGPTRGWTGQGTPVSPAGLQADPRESCCHPGPLDSPRVPRSCQDGREQKSGRPEAEARARPSGEGGTAPRTWGSGAPTSGRQCGVSRAPARTPALAAAPSCRVTGGPPAHVWMTRRGLLWGCHRGRGDCNTRLPRGHTVRSLFAWPYTARLGTVASLNLDPGPTSDAVADTCHPVPSRRWRFPSCHLSIARSGRRRAE